MALQLERQRLELFNTCRIESLASTSNLILQKRCVKNIPMKSKPSHASDRRAESRVRVRYAETDQMGVAYYANYLVWFEVGRSQYCNDCGFSYREMERETELFLIVAEAHCRYRTPARYEDDLIIHTRVTEFTRRTIRFSYEIERADGASVAIGETLHVLINSKGRASSFPEKYLLLLGGENGPADLSQR
jgi:acyl-CoA thioester hydrolase